MRIAINGFGRIGKNFLWAILEDPIAREQIEVVVINSKSNDSAVAAHLFKYDTLMGTYPGTVGIGQHNTLIIDGKEIMLTAILEPEKLPWKEYNIDFVVDCSGAFTDREKAELHLKAGAKKVLISAPAHGDDVTIIPGVNLEEYDHKKHYIISLGSCTTNAFLPVLKVIHENFGIIHGLMTTAHAYTNSQVLLDSEASPKDLRRNRAAALNIVPTTTGASSQVKKVMPILGDKVDAISIRVPVGKVSILDFSFVAEQEISVDKINHAFREAQTGDLEGILLVDDNYLVSSDFNGNGHSVIIDAPMTKALGKLGKVYGWYDNEWAYSVRLKDFLLRANC